MNDDNLNVIKNVVDVISSHKLGYFEKDNNFFIIHNSEALSFKSFIYSLIY